MKQNSTKSLQSSTRTYIFMFNTFGTETNSLRIGYAVGRMVLVSEEVSSVVRAMDQAAQEGVEQL